MKLFGRKARALIAFGICVTACLVLAILRIMPIELFAPTVLALMGGVATYIGGVSHEDAALKRGPANVVAGRDVHAEGNTARPPPLPSPFEPGGKP